MIRGLGNRSLLRLWRHFGAPAKILEATADELSVVAGLRENGKRALLRKDMLRPPEQEWQQLEQEGIEVLTIDDDHYPGNLKAIYDPPAVLFVKGELQPRDLVAVAVVGSRMASPAGLCYTERLCAELVQYGVTVVSGFAVGIDSAAHRGALQGKGRTVAVLGCGLDVNYPMSNRGLREKILPSSGALVTEFDLGTQPAAGHFPQRNRIISGLSLGVVVVEAAHRSGSLITARMALDQGREVFAVPGQAGNFLSAGPHSLLKDGARLVESAEDILEEIRPLIARRRPCSPAKTRVEPVSDEPIGSQELMVLDALGNERKHIDDLSRAVAMPMSRLMAVLLDLELKGRVQQLPGKEFTAIGEGSQLIGSLEDHEDK